MSGSAATYVAPTRGAPFPPHFYDRDTADVARDLLGAVLECTTPAGVARGRIVETEAYLGAHDPACHAAAGLTERTRCLHGPAGTSYVYFVYGMHWCFNAVTQRVGIGSAVLIRALEPLDGLDLMRARRPVARGDRDLANGPGKLCAALGITGAMTGLLLHRAPVMIRADRPCGSGEIVASPRIGIRKAVDWPLRFFIGGNAFVSKPASPFFQRSHVP
ncbi:MAG: DNA-3-methyladenine glycosylase [Gemmatimonadaceae bacterium]